MIKDNPLTTDLIGGKTKKTDERINFFCAADELSAHIMLLTHFLDDQTEKDELSGIVERLSFIMGEVAGGKVYVDKNVLEQLRAAVQKHEQVVGPLKEFILPGKTLLGARVHAVRTIARRTELAYAKVFEAHGGSAYIFEYLNKLSTLLFALARKYDENKVVPKSGK